MEISSGPLVSWILERSPRLWFPRSPEPSPALPILLYGPTLFSFFAAYLTIWNYLVHLFLDLFIGKNELTTWSTHTALKQHGDLKRRYLDDGTFVLHVLICPSNLGPAAQPSHPYDNSCKPHPPSLPASQKPTIIPNFILQYHTIYQLIKRSFA